MDDPKLKDEGKKWVRHYGCAGCHEISGFEDEGRIGTELTFEGSKPIERLDFACSPKPRSAAPKSRSPTKKTWRACRKVHAKGSLVRPQRILRAQTRGAERLRQGQDQDRKPKPCACRTCT